METFLDDHVDPGMGSLVTFVRLEHGTGTETRAAASRTGYSIVAADTTAADGKVTRLPDRRRAVVLSGQDTPRASLS